MVPRLLFLFGLGLWLVPDGQAAPVDFNYDIRPLISAKCYHCHGPDEASRKAKLRLDLREEALKERDGTRAIVPGNPDASELLLRIASHDGDEVMPPPKVSPPLTAAEVELLRRWIEEGAEYKEHWAWLPPQRAQVPEGAAHPVDAFVRARLAAQGLAPSPPAEKLTLLRRVSLDLVGLPPTLEEQRAFAADTAPGAYERAVDRLLASPRFGEKWARLWMDLARYADSTGYGSDALRMNMWPYRDWAIAAFNRDLPYDQFTIEQLAGDLLPNATQDQVIATAFHRNTMTNIEGGTVDEEYRVAAVKDRIATTAQVWMGLTLQCAQCHTHKFDPISHQDYYSFYAIFNQTKDADLRDEAPTLPMPTATDLEHVALLKRRATEAEQKLKEAEQLAPDQQAAWELAVDRAALPPEIGVLLQTPAEERSESERKALADYHRQQAPALVKLRKELADRRREQQIFRPLALPIMSEFPPPQQRKTHVLSKGNYLAPAEEVRPALLRAFAQQSPAPAEAAPVTRLDAARWLVSPANPLTARVAVNRFWAQLFGTGLVETEEDFGTQGSLPSHPELLDWLAVVFSTPKDARPEALGLGWEMKALLRLLVTSDTYRQSSRTEPAHLEKDPRNRWLSHFPRRRLEAEQVRDQALQIAGLLSPKLGGPSVFPPQPEGLWRVAFNGGENAYKPSTGEDRYRRGLYTVWRRTMPYPSMATFDAPSRESCTLRRQPTNTPLQAFVTLNDPCFVECAQAFARRIWAEGGPDVESRLRWALETALVRPAAASQVQILVQLYARELADFAAKPEAAKQLSSSLTQPLPATPAPPELAALTVVANTILNLDGVLMKN